MKRRVLFILLSLTAICLLIWLILPAHNPEPSYQGKPLHEWLALYSQSNGTLKGFDPADEAIRHIGTNAIPALLRLLQRKDSLLKLKLFALAQKQHVFAFRAPQPAWDWNAQGAMGFHALGPDASNAVPALVEIYNQRISMYSQNDVLNALASIGPAAFPDAKQVFLDGLTNADVSMRMEAEYAIGQMHGQPDVFVPALVNSLKDGKNAAYRFVIIQSLGLYGPDAKPAVPALVTLLNDPDYGVRTTATNALKQIDPAAASAAGIK